MVYKEEDLWPGLPSYICEHMSDFSTEKFLEKGEYLFRDQETPNGFYIVRNGLVGLVSITPEGNEQILRLFTRKHFIGHRTFMAEESYSSNAIALQKSHILIINADQFERLVKKYPEVYRSILKYLALELRHSEYRLMALTHQKVEQRIAETLLYLKTRHPDHPWTRREIAEFCGSTTATVIRTLGKFEKMGLILQDRRILEINDIEKFKDFTFDS